MSKALIVWGGWPGHEPETCACETAAILREAGVTSDVSDDLNIFADAQFDDYDLLVPIVTGEHISDHAANRIQAAVRNGLGLGGFHCALATSFKESAPFRFLVGVTWVAHPGDIIDFTVKIEDAGDPLMEGLANFSYRSEQYYLHYDPSVHILASTTFGGAYDPVVENVTMPVAFKRAFGSGRIFYSALGHAARELKHPEGRTILKRGLLWAMRER
ncbi:ThuA domain-containing protein [Martelella mediterranea]|uniref:ThuA-like domain-containing protein n=1 Tax=Martelella mediterranea TaxID=293089 RepID=A0A4R3NRC8_9HYPH|nr:ThuA domain-containing protein [Martelella mediterranea]TCT37637.1 hypothetical protein EDC90_101727 [Martelella mediterranea]